MSEKTQEVERLLVQYFGERRQLSSAFRRKLFGMEMDWLPDSLDHYEYRVKQRMRTLDARPYGVSPQEIAVLQAIAKANKLIFFVEPVTNYHRDHTLLLILTESRLYPEQFLPVNVDEDPVSVWKSRLTEWYKERYPTYQLRDTFQ